MVDAPQRAKGPAWMFWGPVALLVVAGLYLRFANLRDVQPFDGDQGRDFIELYRWLEQKEWPLLGPVRSVGDHCIGPGWFYTLAPMMLLLRFHIEAGSGTIIVFAMAGAILSAWTVRRLSGSAIAGILAAAAWCLAPNWVTLDRFLWNPHLLPFAVVSVLTCMATMDRHPLRALLGYLCLAAILPHWHTTAFVVIAFSLPIIVVQAWHQRRVLAAASRLRLVGAVAILIAWSLFLYLPPLIHELTGDFPNFMLYLRNTFKSAPPFEKPLGERIAYAADFLSGQVFMHDFGPAFHAIPLRIMMAAALVGAWVAAVWRERRFQALAPAVYIALMALVYFYLVQKRGTWINAYFLVPILPLPAFVLCWGGGRLLATEGGTKSAWARRIAGGAGLAVLAAWTLWNVPVAYRIKDGHVWYGRDIVYTREIARGIAREVGDRAFSAMVVQDGNFNSHLHWLLMDAGARPKNWRTYNGCSVSREGFGQWCYVVVRGEWRKLPVEELNLAHPLPKPYERENATIYRIPREIIPANSTWFGVTPRDGRIVFEGIQ